MHKRHWNIPGKYELLAQAEEYILQHYIKKSVDPYLFQWKIFCLENDYDFIATRKRLSEWSIYKKEFLDEIIHKYKNNTPTFFDLSDNESFESDREGQSFMFSTVSKNSLSTNDFSHICKTTPKHTNVYNSYGPFFVPKDFILNSKFDLISIDEEEIEKQASKAVKFT